MKIKKLVDSFNYAIEGIIHAVRTQRNMKIHMGAALLVLIACFFYDLSKFELMAIFISITLVIAFELLNTAIENAMDATTNYYHPLVRIAKNTAAGAVLVTAINAVVVGYIIFWDKLNSISLIIMSKIKNSNPYMIFVVLVIVCILTIVMKAVFGEGTPLRGGMPSGHSTIAFSIATTITLITAEPLTTILSFLLALIVAQSRVDSDVHSVWEVAAGALFGILLTLLLFRIFG